MLDIKNLRYEIDGWEILRDINITLPDEGMTALIGPNGAGKSTLLSLVTRIEPMSGGEVTVDGRALHDIPPPEMAKKVAILTQHQDIQTRLTVRDLLSFGRYPYHQGRPKAEDDAVIDEMLDRMDLRKLADRYLSTLSGGQRQRALIAMTLCQSTKYIFLDEPLNNLDMYYARELMRTLDVYAREKHCSILMVIHDINMSAAWADRLIAIKGGRVVREGTPNEVVTVENMQTIFDMDVEVLTHKGKPLVVNCL